MVRQSICFEAVEGGQEIHCLKCYSAEFNISDTSSWIQFAIRASDEGYVIRCRSCGQEAFIQALQPS